MINMKTSIDLNSYYRSNPYGLVRTICRAIDNESGESMIIYVNVGKGGNASEPFAMSENQFKNAFLDAYGN